MTDGLLPVFDDIISPVFFKSMSYSTAASSQEAGQPVDDIADPRAQSIEQAKQKAEFDRLVTLAEQKKADTRKKVTELRLRFRRLKEQNDRLPERIRLSKEVSELGGRVLFELIT